MQNLRTQRHCQDRYLYYKDSRQTQSKTDDFMQRIIFAKIMYDIFVEFYPSKSISCMVQCNSST